MIRADYPSHNGPGYQGQPQLKGDGAGKAGRGHNISKDPRVHKQVEWQTFKQVCGWAAINTVLEELATCHCTRAPLRLGASTQTQVHVIYWYSCHFAHSMTCHWSAGLWYHTLATQTTPFKKLIFLKDLLFTRNTPV